MMGIGGTPYLRDESGFAIIVIIEIIVIEHGRHLGDGTWYLVDPTAVLDSVKDSTLLSAAVSAVVTGS